MYISTLRSHIEAMGRELGVVASSLVGGGSGCKRPGHRQVLLQYVHHGGGQCLGKLKRGHPWKIGCKWALYWFMLKTETLQITPEILSLIALTDEFKGAWHALGTIRTVAPNWRPCRNCSYRSWSSLASTAVAEGFGTPCAATWQPWTAGLSHPMRIPANVTADSGAS